MVNDNDLHKTRRKTVKHEPIKKQDLWHEAVQAYLAS